MGFRRVDPPSRAHPSLPGLREAKCRMSVDPLQVPGKLVQVPAIVGIKKCHQWRARTRNTDIPRGGDAPVEWKPMVGKSVTAGETTHPLCGVVRGCVVNHDQLIVPIILVQDRRHGPWEHGGTVECRDNYGNSRHGPDLHAGSTPKEYTSRPGRFEGTAKKLLATRLHK